MNVSRNGCVYTSNLVIVDNHAGVVKAFDEAWSLDKAHCPKYFR